MYNYQYPRPALTVDIVLFKFQHNKLYTLLINRKSEPFKGMWAFPGGFVDADETAEQAAIRELWEETGIHKIILHQLYTNSNVNRDPRGWTISVVFYGFINNDIKLVAGDDAGGADWFSINELPDLAFDHSLILKKAMSELENAIRFKPFGIELLPEIFELKQLYALFLSINNSVELAENIVKRLINKRIISKIGENWHFEKIRYQYIYKGGFLS